MGSNKKFKITGTGCSLVDYLYKPVSFSGKAFKRYLSKASGDGGLSPGRLVFTEELENFSNQPYNVLRDEVTGGMKPVAMNIGGPSIVSLIHASQMLSDLNVDISFYGCRGNDEAGEYIEEKLSLTPLETGYYKKGKKFTPFTDVFSDPDYDSGHGERVFINNIGAAWEFEPDDLDDSFFESNIVVFGGTALVPGIHASLDKLLKKAREHKARTIVNTVYDFLNEKKNPGKPWPIGNSNESYRYIDVLISDMEEALRHSGASSVQEAVTFFMEKGVGSLIITHGPNPVIFCADSDLFGSIPLSEVPVSEKVKSELLSNSQIAGDTTGCGDNFAGGVIAFLARQMVDNTDKRIDLTKAVAFGIASGGFACYYLGGTFFESKHGEKIKKVESLYQQYLSQIHLK